MHSTLALNNRCEYVTLRFYDYVLKRTVWQNSSGTFNCSKASDPTGKARVACLREAPTDELMKISARNYQDACKNATCTYARAFAYCMVAHTHWNRILCVTGDTSAWAPVLDGVEFPANSTPMQLLASGNIAPVPIIIGSNSDEGTGFMANDSSMTYPLALNTSGEEWIDWLNSAFISRGIFNHSDVPTP